MRSTLLYLLYMMSSYAMRVLAEAQPIYTQSGSPVTDIPCVGLEPDDRIALVYWYKGDTLEDAVNSPLLQYSSGQAAGTNFTDGDRYTLSASFNLVIRSATPADSGVYWCRFVRQDTGAQRETSVNVVVVSPTDLVLSPCTTSDAGVCNAKASSRLFVECAVTNVAPEPDLTWSLIGCSDNSSQSQRWYASNQRSSFDEESGRYNVTSEMYLGELDLAADTSCSFECHGLGEAIVNQSSSKFLTVTGVGSDTSTDGPTGGNGGVGINRLNLGFTIVLAIVALVCLVGIVFLISRIRFSRGRGRPALEGIEMRKSRDEKMFLLKAPEHQTTGSVVAGEMSSWRFKGELSTEVEGVIAALPTAAGGLVIATNKGIHCLSPPFDHPSEIKGSDLICVASYPNTQRILARLAHSGLVFLDVTTGRTESIFPARCEPTEPFSFTKMSADDVGMIFLAARNTKTLSFIPANRTSINTVKTDFIVGNLAAFGSRHVFISNGRDAIQMYTLKKSSLEEAKSSRKIKIKSTEDGTIKQILVHRGLLYVVCSYASGSQIHQYDVETSDLLQTLTFDLSDVQGLCFFGEHKVAVYQTNAVAIYETLPSDIDSSYVICNA